MIQSALISFASFLMNGLANFGYWICLIIALGGQFAYLSGFKSGAKWTMFSTVSYVIIEGIAGALR